jgi:hypothetical protein
MRQARTSGRRRAEVGQLARAAVLSSKFRAHSYKFENSAQNTQNCAQIRTVHELNLLSITCFVKTEDFSQVISQSESPSVTRGPTLVSWGWTTNQDTNKGFTGSKSHIFNFSRSLGVKTVSVLVHKKNWSMLEISCCRPLQWALDGICL